VNDQRANADGASGDRRSSRAWLALAGAVALAVLTVAVFAPVRHFDFVDLDDPQYVFENPNVTGGLTWSGVRWALTTPHASFWIPAVWISYMADIEIFGQGPAGHHVTNLLLDIWPLGRLGTAPDAGRRMLVLARGKLPLVAMSLGVGVVTVVAHHGNQAVLGLDQISLPGRLLNALLSYFDYVRLTVWPAGLAAYYSLPASVPPCASGPRSSC